MHGTRSNSIRQRRSKQLTNNRLKKLKSQQTTTTTTSPLTTTKSSISTLNTSPITNISNPLLQPIPTTTPSSQLFQASITQQHPLTTQSRSFGVQRRGSSGNKSHSSRKSSKQHRHQEYEIDFNDIASLFDDNDSHQRSSSKSSSKRNNKRGHNPMGMDLGDFFEQQQSGYSSPAFKRSSMRHNAARRGQTFDSDMELEMFFDGSHGTYGLDMDSSDLESFQHQTHNKRNQKSSRSSSKRNGNQQHHYDDSDEQHYQQQHFHSGEMGHDDMREAVFNMFGGNSAEFGFEDLSHDRHEKRQQRKQDKAINSKRIMKTIDGVEIFDNDKKVQEVMSQAELREAEVIDVENSRFHTAQFAKTEYYRDKNDFKHKKYGKTAGNPIKNPNKHMGGELHDAQYETKEDIAFRAKQEQEWQHTFYSNNVHNQQQSSQSQQSTQPKREPFTFHGYNQSTITEATVVDENDISQAQIHKRRIIIEDVNIDGHTVHTNIHGKKTFTNVPDEIPEYTGRGDAVYDELRQQIEAANLKYVAEMELQEKLKNEEKLKLQPNSRVQAEFDNNMNSYQKSKIFKEAATTPSATFNAMMGDVAEKSAQRERMELEIERMNNITKDDITSIKMVQPKMSLGHDSIDPLRQRPLSSQTKNMNDNSNVNIMDNDVNLHLDQVNNTYNNMSGVVHKLHERLQQHHEQIEQQQHQHQHEQKPFDMKTALHQIKHEIRIESAKTPQEREILTKFPNLTQHAYGLNTQVEEEVAKHTEYQSTEVENAEGIAEFIRDAVFNRTLKIKLLQNAIQEKYSIVKNKLKSKYKDGSLPHEEYLHQRAQLEDLMIQKDNLIILFASQRDGQPISNYNKNDQTNKNTTKSTSATSSKSTTTTTPKQSASSSTTSTATTTTTTSKQPLTPSINAATSGDTKPKRTTLEQILLANKLKKEKEALNAAAQTHHRYGSSTHFDDDAFTQKPGSKKGRRNKDSDDDELQAHFDFFQNNNIFSDDSDTEKVQRLRSQSSKSSSQQQQRRIEDDFTGINNMQQHLFGDIDMSTSHRPSQRLRKDESQRLHNTYRPSRRFSTITQQQQQSIMNNTTIKSNSLLPKLKQKLSQLFNINQFKLSLTPPSPFSFHHHQTPILTTTISQRHFSSSQNRPKPGRVASLTSERPFDDRNIRLDSLLASPSHRDKQLKDDELKPVASRKMQQFKRQEELKEKEYNKIQDAKSKLKTSLKDLTNLEHKTSFIEKQSQKVQSANQSVPYEVTKNGERIYNVPTKQGRKALRDAKLKDQGKYGKKQPKQGPQLSHALSKAIYESAIRNADGTKEVLTFTSNGNIKRKKKGLSGMQRAQATAKYIAHTQGNPLAQLGGSYPTTHEQAERITANTTKKAKLPVWLADMENDPFMLHTTWSEGEEVDHNDMYGIRTNNNNGDNNNNINSDGIPLDKNGQPIKLTFLEEERLKSERAFTLTKREENHLLEKSIQEQMNDDTVEIDTELGALLNFKTDPISLIQQRKIDLIPEEDETRFELLFAKGIIREQIEAKLQQDGNILDLELDLDSSEAEIPIDENSIHNHKNENEYDDVDQLLNNNNNNDMNDDILGETAGESEMERALEQLLQRSDSLAVESTSNDVKIMAQELEKNNDKLTPQQLQQQQLKKEQFEKKPRTKAQLIEQLTNEKWSQAVNKLHQTGKFRSMVGFTSHEAQLAKFEEELVQQSIEAKMEDGLGYISELDSDIDDEYSKNNIYKFQRPKLVDDDDDNNNNKNIDDDNNDVNENDDNDNESSSDEVIDTNNIYLPKKYMALHKKGLYTQKASRRKSKAELAEERRTSKEWNRDTDEFYQTNELLQMKGFDIQDDEEELRLQRRLDRYQNINAKFQPGRAPEQPLAKKKHLHNKNQYDENGVIVHHDDDNNDDDDNDTRFDDLEYDEVTDDDEFMDSLLNDNDDNYDENGMLKPGHTHISINNNDRPSLQTSTTFTTKKNRKDMKNILDLEELVEELSDEFDFEDQDEIDYVKGFENETQQPVAKIIGGESFFTFELHEDDLDEHFVRGSGPGGQSVNKTKNCVVLQHKPTSTVVKCSQTRELHINRAIARKIMKRKLEALFKGKDSYLGRKIERLQRKKQKAARRQKSSDKYATKRDQEIALLRTKLGLDATSSNNDNNNGDDDIDNDGGEIQIIRKSITKELNPDVANVKTKM